MEAIWLASAAWAAQREGTASTSSHEAKKFVRSVGRCWSLVFTGVNRRTMNNGDFMGCEWGCNDVKVASDGLAYLAWKKRFLMHPYDIHGISLGVETIP